MNDNSLLSERIEGAHAIYSELANKMDDSKLRGQEISMSVVRLNKSK